MSHMMCNLELTLAYSHYSSELCRHRHHCVQVCSSMHDCKRSLVVLGLVCPQEQDTLPKLHAWQGV